MIQVECKRCRGQMDDFLCSELLVETSQEVLRHLARCPDCREDFERRQDLRRRLARVVEVKAPESLRARVLAQSASVSAGTAATASHPAGPRPSWSDRAPDVGPVHRSGMWSAFRRVRGASHPLKSLAKAAGRPRAIRLMDGVSLLSQLAVLGAVIVVAVWLVFDSAGTLSAAEVLRRADDHLGKLLKPGSVLYRRWHRTFVVRTGGGPPTTVAYVNEEWAEGSAPGRAAGRYLLPDGRLALAVWTTPESGGLRSRWFNAGLLPSLTEPDPPDSLPAVYVWPNDEEVRSAVAGYPERERERVLDLVRSYEPIVGNEATYSFLTRSARSERLDATADRVHLANGRPGIRVTVRVPDGSFSSFRGHPFRRVPASPILPSYGGGRRTSRVDPSPASLSQ
jgi:hypothetical protein